MKSFLFSCLALLELTLLPLQAQSKSGCARIVRKTAVDFFGRPYKADWVETTEDAFFVQSFLRSNRGWRDLRKIWARSTKSRPVVSRLLNLDVLQGKKVLDAGTGGGLFVEELINEGIDVTGIDLKLTPHQKRKSHFIESDIRKTPLPSQHYDLIVNSYNLFHYANRDSNVYGDALKEEARLLKPGGKAMLIEVLHGHEDIWNSSDFKVVFPDKIFYWNKFFLLERK